MKKALLILHQKTSEAGNLEKKLIQRGFILEYSRPPLGDILPTNIEKYDAIIIAVAHDEFKLLTEKQIRSYGKSNHILYDIKYLLKANETDGRL